MVDCHATSLIDDSVPTDIAITALLVFPKSESALAPRPLRHFPGVALLRLDDGTVWMLNLPGRAWTSGRLRVAADTLSHLSSQALELRWIERQLRRALGLNSVMLTAPVLGTIDPRQWGICETAQALLERNRLLPGGNMQSRPDYKARVRSIESSLARELREALHGFVDGMDPRVKAMATTECRIDVMRYNYLAYKQYQQYRQQFANSFPSLLPAVVTAAHGSLGAGLRPMVDQGVPLVKSLAARWNVRPGVVRHLVDRSTDQIGVQWSSNVKTLAIVLNVLRPEDLPGDDLDDWSQFNDKVAIGQDLFRKPIWKSAVALQWLRECVYHTNRGSNRTRSRWLPDRNTMTSIGRLRDLLIVCLRHDVRRTRPDIAGSVSTELEAVVDRFFFTSAHRGLGEIASRLEEELYRLWEESSQASKVASGKVMLPLIPVDFVSSDGARVIQPLTTHSQLFSHGFALDNCLSKGYAFHFLSKGARGTTFIVGVIERETGEPCSTAEIAVKRDNEMLTYGLVVEQHTAKSNRNPSTSCIRAIGELISYCRTPDVRRYLEHAWQLIHNGSRPYRRGGKVEIDSTMTIALRRTLGEEVYEYLLARTLEQSAPEGDD